MKKIILIWDFDGAIGQINSTLPYNFNFKQLAREQDNVRYILDVLDRYHIKSTFAITGFSAEEGIEPYVFPELIHEISARGHEVASHSWRHEWISLFTKQQVSKSLIRSKASLENAMGAGGQVIGFVPPHNRPMTWWARGALSIGDRGLFPLFPMGDTSQLIKVLKEAGYKWIRVSYQPMSAKIGLHKSALTGRVLYHKGIMVLENHYTGFDSVVVDHILNSSKETFTVSAHPLMLDFENKAENRGNFGLFLERLTNTDQSIEFVRPCDLLTKDQIIH